MGVTVWVYLEGEDLVNTNAIKVSVFPVEYSYESDTLSMDVHYDVRLLSISEDYYRYMKIMEGVLYHDRRRVSFGALIEPADTYSNVENVLDCRRISRG